MDGSIAIGHIIHDAPEVLAGMVGGALGMYAGYMLGKTR